MNLMSIFKRKPDGVAAEVVEAAPARRAGRSIRRVLGRAFETAFSAAKTDRLNFSWSGSPMTADSIIKLHQQILVARSRQQSTENDYAKAFLRLCRQNIVGPAGVLYRAQTGDEAINQAIEEAWIKWGKAKNCDVTTKKSWRDFELAAVQSAAKDGEFMFRFIYGKDAGPWGFCLQHLDPQRCPVDYDVQRWGDSGNFIRNGIEFTAMGRPVSFHFTTTNAVEAEYYGPGGKAFTVIPADQIIHGFRDELGGQKRGLPWMATALFKLRHVTGMEDAAVVNARVGAAKMGFMQWQDGKAPDWAKDAAEDAEGLTIDAEAGSFPILPEGLELKEWQPQYPNDQFTGFSKHLLRSIATGLGVLYNNLASDLEGVNFSSIRQGTLDERERWKDDQAWLVETLHEQVFEAWLTHSLLSGHIKNAGQSLRASKLETYAKGEWQPRRWTWIDPNADVKAAVESKNNLLKSPGELIREGGRDPLTVYKEIAGDIEAMKAAGIPDEIIKLAFSDKLAPQPPGAPKSENKSSAA